MSQLNLEDASNTEPRKLVVCGFNILEPLQYRKRATLAFWVFVALNIMVGTFSVWSPLLMSMFRTDICFFDQLNNQLQQGALYFFAIPFIATSLGGLLSALAEDNMQSRRTARISVLVVAAFFLAFMILFLLFQTGSGTTSIEKQTGFTVYFLQPACLLISVLLGIYIFCLSNYHLLQPSLAKENDKARDERNVEAQSAKDDVLGLQLGSN
ncbi:MAG: hypothetical protein U1C96_00165 [Gallionella sp.]|nr:hypothetical protein [Gallionella sp.]